MKRAFTDLGSNCRLARECERLNGDAVSKCMSRPLCSSLCESNFAGQYDSSVELCRTTQYLQSLCLVVGKDPARPGKFMLAPNATVFQSALNDGTASCYFQSKAPAIGLPQ